MNKTNYKQLSKSNRELINTTKYLINCVQNNFQSLDLYLRILAYRFNLAQYQMLDKFYKDKADKKVKLAKKTVKENNGVITVANAPDDEDQLPDLTAEQKKLSELFIKDITAYLFELPCFNKIESCDRKALILTFTEGVTKRKNTPNSYIERIKMLDPNYMTKYLLDNFNVIKIERGQTELAYWNGKTYQTGEQAISDLVTKIRSVEFNDATDKRYREPFNLKALINSLKNAITETTPLAPADYIPCLNGIVHLDRDKIQLELQPFTPDIVTIYQYRANFKPLSEIPAETANKLAQYLDLLSNIERETEAHYKELKNRILEGTSIVLFRDQIFKTFLFFHGSHDGGKTSFIERVVFGLLPNDSYSKLPINRLNERFAMSELVGKLANLNDEHNFNYGRTGQAEQAILKEIVSGGQKLRAERKNVNAFDFVCEAKMFIALNDFLNITDENTEAKMLYIPMRGNLSRAECAPFYPDMSNQDEKDYIFNVLLQNLLQVFKNRKTTDKYFTPSEYIDVTLKNEAKLKTSEVLQELQSWINETNPFKCYPLGKLLSYETAPKMFASFYYRKFLDYRDAHNSHIKISSIEFKKQLSEVSEFKCLDNAKENSKSYRSVLVPKNYKGTRIYSYADYKQAVLLEQAQREDTAKIIALNTKAEADRVSAELGQI